MPPPRSRIHFPIKRQQGFAFDSLRSVDRSWCREIEVVAVEKTRLSVTNDSSKVAAQCVRTMCTYRVHRCSLEIEPSFFTMAHPSILSLLPSVKSYQSPLKPIQLEINNSRPRALLKLLSPRNKLIVSWTLAPDVSFPLDSGNKILIARPLEKKGQDRKNLKRIKKKLGPVEAGGESRSVKFLSMRLVS